MKVPIREQVGIATSRLIVAKMGSPTDIDAQRQAMSVLADLVANNPEARNEVLRVQEGMEPVDAPACNVK